MLIPVINIIYQRFLTHRVNVYLAGEVGLEPTTICLTDKRAANCATSHPFLHGRATGNRTQNFSLEEKGYIRLTIAPITLC